MKFILFLFATLTLTVNLVLSSHAQTDPQSIYKTAHIEVMGSKSSANVKLYKDAQLTKEATGTIGGTVYVTLEVTLGKYQKLVSNNATLRIEENYDQHSETERRWDRIVSFTDGWQIKDSNGEWQDTIQTPQAKNSSGGEKYFRKVWSWLTYSKPLGHNETHTVSLVKVDGGADTELTFTPTNEGDDGKEELRPVTVQVANLVITDVSTNSGKPDYFTFGIDNKNKYQTLSFAIKDKVDPHQYKWTVKVRYTNDKNSKWSVFCKGVALGPQKISIKLNKPDAPNIQEGRLIYIGAYTFEILVQEYDDLSKQKPQMLDSQTLRSKYLYSPDTYDGNNPGHDFYNEWIDGDLHALFEYYIVDTEGKDASKVHVDFLDPEWTVKSSKDLSTATNTPHLDIDLYTYQPGMLSGYYAALLSAKDNHALRYRDHQDRWMATVN